MLKDLLEELQSRKAPPRPTRDWIQTFITALPGLAAAAALIFTWLSINATTKATNNQLQIAEQGQITDRYNAAITNLGSRSIDVRLGGIYALQRIMQDSVRDQPTIVGVLCAFVRDQATPATVKSRQAASPAPSELPTDIQAALTVVGTRNTAHDGSTTVVDLTGADLPYANVYGAHLAGAKLIHVDLSGTNLSATDLHGANLALADLVRADLTGQDLRDVNLYRADLSSAYLSRADLSGAYLSRVDLTSAYLSSANLAAAYLDGTNLSRAHLGGANLTGAYLRSADLSGANLGHADLTGADLTGADLTGADLTGAELTGAELTGAKGLPRSSTGSR